MTIRGLYEETGTLIDPHTAVGVAAAREEAGDAPMIVLSTAHPAKFPDAVKRATGRVADQPERLRVKLGQDERFTVLANDYGAIAEFIAARARAQGGTAPAGSARAKRSRTEVRRVSIALSRLANGLTVVSHERPDVETASLGIWVGAGSRSEGVAEHGVAHFLEHMAFKGTARRSAQAIAEEIEAVGGDLNAATGVD